MSDTRTIMDKTKVILGTFNILGLSLPVDGIVLIESQELNKAKLGRANYIREPKCSLHILNNTSERMRL